MTSLETTSATTEILALRRMVRELTEENDRLREELAARQPMTAQQVIAKTFSETSDL